MDPTNMASRPCGRTNSFVKSINSNANPLMGDAIGQHNRRSGSNANTSDAVNMAQVNL